MPPKVDQQSMTSGLLSAIKSGRIDLAVELIAAGSDPNAAVTVNTASFFVIRTTPLWIAATRGQTRIVRELIKAGARVDTQCAGTTPLWQATHSEHLGVALELLQAGASPNTPGTAGDETSAQTTPLWLATEKGNLGLVQALITGNAWLDQTTGGGTEVRHFRSPAVKIIAILH